jgi:hypothetical protein
MWGWGGRQQQPRLPQRQWRNARHTTYVLCGNGNAQCFQAVDTQQNPALAKPILIEALRYHHPFLQQEGEEGRRPFLRTMRPPLFRPPAGGVHLQTRWRLKAWDEGRGQDGGGREAWESEVGTLQSTTAGGHHKCCGRHARMLSLMSTSRLNAARRSARNLRLGELLPPTLSVKTDRNTSAWACPSRNTSAEKRGSRRKPQAPAGKHGGHSRVREGGRQRFNTGRQPKAHS